MKTDTTKRRRPTPSPAPAPRSQRESMSLHEAVVRLGKPERVDRDKGVLYGVKVLGLESQNGRRYTPEAVKRALSLYEGLGVYTNHPKNPGDVRDVRDRFGWFEGIREDADGGLRGDFHLLDPADPLSVKVMNAAEQKPDLFGFSHNAEGDGYRDADGTFIVEEISDVRSVDLVAEPATTGGLFEGRNRNQAMKKKLTLRKFLETVTLPKLVKAKATAPAKALKKLLAEEKDACVLDEEDMGMAMPEDEPAPPADGSDWRKSLATTAGELLASEDPEAHDIAKKLQGILKPATAATTEADESEEEEPVTESEEEEPKAKTEGRTPKARRKPAAAGDATSPAVTSLQEEVATLKKQLQDEKDAAALSTWVAEECRKRKLVDVDADLLESITVSGDRKKIAVRLDKLKALAGSGQRHGPRSRFQGLEGAGAGADKRPTNGKEFAEALRSGSRG